MNNLSLEDWRQVLRDIKDKRRHRLTGSEYKAIVEAVDNHRHIGNAQRLAMDVAALLADHEGPRAKPPFKDPNMNRVFVEQNQVHRREKETMLNAILTDDSRYIEGVVTGEISRALENSSIWEDRAAAGEAVEEGRAAIRLIEGGAYDEALVRLKAAGELEEKYAGVSGPSFAGAAGVLESEWRAWQRANGVGPSITPAMKRDFDAIPQNLGELSPGKKRDGNRPRSNAPRPV